MAHLTTLLTRPSALGTIAVLGSGAFYVGMKYKTLIAKQAWRLSEDGEGGDRQMNYEVKTGRSGGGV